jgi:hypothetical protein
VVREELRAYSSSGMGSKSGWNAGNLKVALGLESRPEIDAMARCPGGVEGMRSWFRWLRHLGRKGCDVEDARSGLVSLV